MRVQMRLVDDAAHAFPLGGDVLPHDALTLLVGIVRDLVRVTVTAAQELDAPPETRSRGYERIHELLNEYRRADRAVRAATLGGPCEPLQALRRATLLRRLRAVSGASADPADAVHGVVSELD